MASPKSQLPEAQPLGAHFSIAKGLDQAIRDAESIGARAAQIFLHSNRQWRMKDLDQERIDRFKKAMKDSPVGICVVHASYLLNLGSPDPILREKSIAVLTKELQQCNLLGIPYLIMHPGSCRDDNLKACLRMIADGINTALENAPGPAAILLENTAGQGTTVGFDLAHLRDIMAQVKDQSRIGICFDTCHGFAAGYHFTEPQAYDDFWKHFDKILGIDSLKVFHFNDSKKMLGSRVDRHEDIGKGYLGLEPFALILNDKRFWPIPKILETPYEKYPEGLRDYKRNLAVLKSLITER